MHKTLLWIQHFTWSARSVEILFKVRKQCLVLVISSCGHWFCCVVFPFVFLVPFGCWWFGLIARVCDIILNVEANPECSQPAPRNDSISEFFHCHQLFSATEFFRFDSAIQHSTHSKKRWMHAHCRYTYHQGILSCYWSCWLNVPRRLCIVCLLSVLSTSNITHITLCVQHVFIFRT